jgi:hypothetical protein
MSRTLAGVLVALVALAFMAGVTSAGIPDPDKSFVTMTKADPDGMATCPALDALPYQYIKVTAERLDNSPIEGIPYTSFFFTVTGGAINITNVDAQTDANGEIRFKADDAEPLAVGSVTIGCQIYTVVLNDSDVLQVNCMDINGNGGVESGDFAYFVADYGHTDRPRSDFNWSGTVESGDFAIFVAHYGD